MLTFGIGCDFHQKCFKKGVNKWFCEMAVGAHRLVTYIRLTMVYNLEIHKGWCHDESD